MPCHAKQQFQHDEFLSRRAVCINFHHLYINFHRLKPKH